MMCGYSNESLQCSRWGDGSAALIRLVCDVSCMHSVVVRAQGVAVLCRIRRLYPCGFESVGRIAVHSALLAALAEDVRPETGLRQPMLIAVECFGSIYRVVHGER